jgi:hypothetical protein
VIRLVRTLEYSAKFNLSIVIIVISQNELDRHLRHTANGQDLNLPPNLKFPYNIFLMNYDNSLYSRPRLVNHQRLDFRRTRVSIILLF